MKLFRSAVVLVVAAVLVLASAGAAAARGDDAKPHKDPDQADKKGHGDADPKAKDSHGDAKDKEARGDAHKSHGIFDFAFEQGIWTVAVFVLLLIILRKYAWGPILEGLHKREEHIRLAVEEAKLARHETEKVRTEFRAEMAKAYAEIPKIMEEARRDATNLREEMKSKAVAEIQADRDRLRREIETARDQALQELWSQAATLATLISAKAIGRSLTAEDQRRLNDEALTQVESASTQGKSEMRRFGEEWTRKGGGSA